MGDRSQVHIEDTDVYLYTHWGATDLPLTVQKALARKARWNDPSYLTRIIFDQMTGGDGGTAGYGIDDIQHGDVYRVIHINCSEGEVTVETGVAPWHDDEEANAETYTFEEYIEADPEWPSR